MVLQVDTRTFWRKVTSATEPFKRTNNITDRGYNNYNIIEITYKKY